MSAPQDPFVPPHQGTPPAGWPPGYAPPPAYPPPHVAYGPPYPGYPPPAATNGFAIASLVLGLLWVYWIGSILALVFGYVALRQIKQRNESGRGMAIAGVVLGWVGVVMLPLVVLVVFALGSAVQGEFEETCEAFPSTDTSVPC